ncbi:hypothetical protein DL771_008204 [Monosporascus sp. 5C6A]|nr:hypothetical protein DL771_008204 [Monosporascus sp. 5C6A]
MVYAGVGRCKSSSHLRASNSSPTKATGGDKTSFERLLSEITSIPVAVLQGHPLSDCTIDERFSWAERREATFEEDRAYSLLGIFDVYEGRAQMCAYVPGQAHDASQQRKSPYYRADGLRGMGKTRLAIAYAKRREDDYSGISWLNIEADRPLKHSFRRIASQIEKAHSPAQVVTGSDDNGNIDEVIAAVPGNTDPTAIDIKTCLPESYEGAIIITTRVATLQIGHHVAVRKLERMNDSLEATESSAFRGGQDGRVWQNRERNGGL